jgi:tRNA threonylcarbamoyladenosine biosynthesis protein TsaE
MTKQQSWQVQTLSAEATEELAVVIGKNIKGGEVIELVSDLGGGKTTFTRGLAKGFGSPDRVTSPTFTISKVYRNGSKEMHHFDFYRLPEAGLIEHELSEVIDDPSCTVVVEWAQVVAHVLPSERLQISISQTGEEERTLNFRFPNELSYLLEGAV